MHPEQLTALRRLIQPPRALTESERAQLDAARQGQKFALGRLISLFENPRPPAVEARQAFVHTFHTQPQPIARRGLVIGVTGTPGAGKSSLINELCQQMLAQDAALTIAVLAVDPSSHHSGGAILGDRTRMRTQGKQERLLFRSQASNLELGGITHNTFQAIRLLRYLFDLIIIETVGIGQNEVDIQHMTDHTFLVMQPLAGDQIQFMKSGIMEIPDSFVINKCDEDKLARNSYYLLRTALKQARLLALDAHDDHQRANQDQIFLTSALRGLGIAELASFILSLPTKPNAQIKRESFYLGKAIQQAYGEFGLQHLNQLQKQPDWPGQHDYDHQYAYVLIAIQSSIKGYH